MVAWKIFGLTIYAPKLKDPRLFMIGILIIYTVIGHTILAFDQSWGQAFTTIGIACLCDVVVNYWKTKQIVVPASGLITGMGLGLLLVSTPWWPYIVAPILAIISKLLFNFRGKHMFNPSNFGLTVLLLLFPSTVTALAAQWSGSLLMVMTIVVIGGFTTFRVSRWDLVMSFLVGFAIMAVVQQLFTNRGAAFVFGPMIGAAFQLFTLSMLTDPKTTPDTRRMRVIFGFALAALDGILRILDVQHSLFIALLFVSATSPVLRLVEPFARAGWKALLSDRKVKVKDDTALLSYQDRS
jgi:Na+-translocating ferredoxin:NAD+ oxidoreductase RnfD subunit